MIKITGTRSLQNKLSRMSSDLSHDADRILREKPELAHIVDDLHVMATRLRQVAVRLSKES